MDTFMKGDFCYIDGFEPSARTLDAIDKMNEVGELAQVAEKFTIIGTFWSIFGGRKASAGVTLSVQGWNASNQDWNVFQDAIKGIAIMKRRSMERIAFQESLYAKGNDQKF